MLRFFLLSLLFYIGYVPGVSAEDARGVSMIGIDSCWTHLGTVPNFYTTYNSGASWQISDDFPLPTTSGYENLHLGSIVCDTTHTRCIAVGSSSADEDAVIAYVTIDRGVHWELIPIETIQIDAFHDSSLLNSIACDLTQTHCITVGTRSHNRALMYSTADGGIHWKKGALWGEHFKISAMKCDPDVQNCILIGENASGGTIGSYVTRDGGLHWERSAYLQVPYGYNGLHFHEMACDLGLNRCVVVGGMDDNLNSRPNGVSYRTYDGGKHWIASRPRYPFDGAHTFLDDVVCDNQLQSCIAAGYYFGDPVYFSRPITFYSSDMGKIWTLLSLDLPENTETIIDRKGFAGSSGGWIDKVRCNKNFKTCIALGVYFPNSEAGGSPLGYISQNSGKTWQLMQLSRHPNCYKMSGVSGASLSDN